MSRPQPRQTLKDLPPYIGGKSKVSGLSKTFKLSANESPLGASPKARSAFESFSKDLALYPEGTSADLRQAIAEVHELNADQLICGNGSDEVLTFLASSYLQPGDEAIYSRHGFVYYPMVIKAAGGSPVIAEETNYTANVDTLLNCVSDKTRMVFLANPNNPTGTYLNRNELKRLHDGLPPHVLLVIDAAYAEYVSCADYNAGIDMVQQFENVVMTRTFSKIYGLASLRVGWAYCPASIADILNRLRGPFNVNAAGQVAAAEAVRDVEFTRQAAAYNEEQRESLRSEFEKLGLEVTPSIGNFLLLHFPKDEKKGAAAADQFLQSQGIILRRLEGYHLPHALRLTVGLEAQNKAVIAALSQFLEN